MTPRAQKFDGLSIALETSRIQSVITVPELDYTTNCIPDRRVVMGHKVFQRLHKPSLHVTGLCCLDGSIDQTFTTRDSVEQELGRRESRVEAITNKALGRWFSGLLWEMRERAVLETIRDTVTSDDLLADTSNHLRDVNNGTYARSQPTARTM